MQIAKADAFSSGIICSRNWRNAARHVSSSRHAHRPGGLDAIKSALRSRTWERRMSSNHGHA